MKGDPDPRRLLLAGDVHGNEWWVAVLAGVASRLGCDAILQVGDLGYDPRDKAGRRFLRRADAAMDLFGLRLFWIDDNHDNHDALAAEARDDNGMTVIGSRLRHLPRGRRWEWSGVRFGALGGAFSPDWEERKKRGDWWPAEAVTDEDVEALGHEPLDVLVSHDAPIGVPLNSGLRLVPVDEMRGEENRHRVGRAVERTLPRLLVHGHWHHRYSFELSWIDHDATEASGSVQWASTQVEGLGADIDGDDRAWAVLELPGLRVVSGAGVIPGEAPGIVPA